MVAEEAEREREGKRMSEDQTPAWRQVLDRDKAEAKHTIEPDIFEHPTTYSDKFEKAAVLVGEQVAEIRELKETIENLNEHNASMFRSWSKALGEVRDLKKGEERQLAHTDRLQRYVRDADESATELKQQLKVMTEDRDEYQKAFRDQCAFQDITGKLADAPRDVLEAVKAVLKGQQDTAQPFITRGMQALVGQPEKLEREWRRRTSTDAELDAVMEGATADEWALVRGAAMGAATKLMLEGRSEYGAFQAATETRTPAELRAEGAAEHEDGNTYYRMADMVERAQG